jgi:undecaprenyl-diphosphatase
MGEYSMISFDSSVFHWINQFAGHSHAFDAVMVLFSESHFLKGGAVMAMFWYLWFRGKEDHDLRREVLLVNLLSCIVVIIAARTLATFLPFRERPLQTSDLGFRLPLTMNSNTLIHWSSFPSDHAAMFFASATGLWFVDRRWGVLAGVYVLFVICLPRIYVGLHYPTDILAGAILGAGIAALAEVIIGRHWRGQWFTFWWSRRRPVLYALLFLLCYQIATLFDDIRLISGLLMSLCGRWV